MPKNTCFQYINKLQLARCFSHIQKILSYRDILWLLKKLALTQPPP